MTSITIESTNTSNVTKQKSIPYINENASDSELLAFAQAVNNLTKNTYVKTDRIDKRNLDSSTVTDRPVIKFLTNVYEDGAAVSNKDITDLTEFSVNINQLGGTNHNQFAISFAGTRDVQTPCIMTATANDGQPFLYYSSNFFVAASSNNYVITLVIQQLPGTYNFTINIPATKLYNPIEKSWTVHFINTEEG